MRHGDKVEPGIQSVFPAFETGVAQQSPWTRAMACGPGNPLTARVTVNRFWQMFFGAGS